MFLTGLFVGLFVGFNLGLLVMAVFQVGASNETSKDIARANDTRFGSSAAADRVDPKSASAEADQLA